MPKHGNIFTSWFKSGKQKHKKSQQQYPIKNQSNADSSFEPAATTVKRSPLMPREPTNDSRSDLSPRSRRTSIFGLTFGLASSTGSSRLSLLSGNSKQTVQHKSTSCIETQCSLYEQQHQNGSILRKSSATVETTRENVNPNAQPNNHSQPSKSPATPPRKQSKSGSITSAGFLQQLAAQLHPGRTSPRSPNTGSANSSLQNIPSGGTTPTPPRSPTNQTSNPPATQSNCTTTTAPLTFHRNSSLKQSSVIFSGSLDQGSSAFTPIASFNAAVPGTSQKPFLQRQATTQQQKQIQFQQQHHSNQSYSFQKLAYSQPLNEFGQAASPNIMSSSGLITTINESFTESNQDSSDAEIVEVFAGEHGKSRTGTLDLVDEQLIFNGPEGEEKAKDNRRPCSPAPFNLTPNEQKAEEPSRKDSQPEKSPLEENAECEVPDQPVKKKTSFADESENMDSSMFPKCKLGHRDTLRDSLKDSLIDNLRETMNQGDEIDRLEDGKVLKRKSVDLNELGDSTDQQEQQGAEETDSFGELVTNDEDFSLYENRTGLGDDLKFLASMPELVCTTHLALWPILTPSESNSLMPKLYLSFASVTSHFWLAKIESPSVPFPPCWVRGPGECLVQCIICR